MAFQSIQGTPLQISLVFRDPDGTVNAHPLAGAGELRRPRWGRCGRCGHDQGPHCGPWCLTHASPRPSMDSPHRFCQGSSDAGPNPVDEEQRVRHQRQHPLADADRPGRPHGPRLHCRASARDPSLGIDPRVFVFGATISFKTTTDGPFGSSLDPSYNVTFDAVLSIYLAVPTDASIALGVRTEVTTNVTHEGTNFWGDTGRLGERHRNVSGRYLHRQFQQSPQRAAIQRRYGPHPCGGVGHHSALERPRRRGRHRF